MISISGVRLSTYACSESTRCQTGSNPVRLNSCSNSSASWGLSSTSRILRRWAKLVLPFGRLIEKGIAENLSGRGVEQNNPLLAVHTDDRVHRRVNYSSQP